MGTKVGRGGAARGVESILRVDLVSLAPVTAQHGTATRRLNKTSPRRDTTNSMQYRTASTSCAERTPTADGLQYNHPVKRTRVPYFDARQTACNISFFSDMKNKK